MSQSLDNKENRQPMLGMAMAGLASQIGCLTVVILFAALFGGLWLDKVFDSKPIITILLVVISAPVSLGLTFWVAMRAAKRVSAPLSTKEQTKNFDEEEQTGE
jgi:F0F1-type ATP synthase assembly protein I